MARQSVIDDSRNVNGILYETVDQDGGILITKKQDVSAILAQAKRERDAFPEHNGHYGRDMVKAATIPNIEIEKLMRNGIWFDKKRLKAWLNDPDNRAFRTSRGVI